MRPHSHAAFKGNMNEQCRCTICANVILMFVGMLCFAQQHGRQTMQALTVWAKPKLASKKDFMVPMSSQ